jgi:hypothetical protein
VYWAIILVWVRCPNPDIKNKEANRMRPNNTSTSTVSHQTFHVEVRSRTEAARSKGFILRRKLTYGKYSS